MSRSHPQQWRIREDVTRASAEQVEAFRAYPTTQIADTLGPIGVIGPGIVPVTERTEFCGSAVTVWTKPGDILFLLKAPDLVQAGDVLVVDGGGRLDAAILGDFITGLLRDRGAVGLVVDGAVRDVDGIRETGLPAFARGVHPATASKEGPGAINVDVCCGGVIVRPGDIVRGDASGVVVVPRTAAGSVLAATREIAAREQQWQRALGGGATFSDVLGLDDLIARLSADVDDTPLP